jgi:hypothetical protein
MFKRIGFSFLLGLIVLAGLYLTVVFEWSYSSGERAGWVQKFSRKGWVCKTWEGEIAMVTLPGSVPEIFPFTVRDEAVANRIAQSVGQRVTLHYEQHRGLPGTCFGETEYWVDSVTVIPWLPLGAQPGAAAPAAPSPVNPAPPPASAVSPAMPAAPASAVPPPPAAAPAAPAGTAK